MNADLAKCMKVWIVPDIEISRSKISDGAKYARAVRFAAELPVAANPARLIGAAKGNVPPYSSDSRRKPSRFWARQVPMRMKD
ncbi:hypothetical protein BQ8482_210013 [Mesorhizobium delmotii]|uniref:Uncharacterized protein n=1 Tax=Mesorhizobium delmotii TaxID=1631247 RepID=A0A2P9AKV4_9HYPH|nr:hypothetical protein BQ8482_210013 [Mesorhizobium delmotii]